jgi:hypothetical protein
MNYKYHIGKTCRQMKTFQQFQEDARGAGVTTRQYINRAASAVGDFYKGYATGKAGTQPGSAQHRGAQVRGVSDAGMKASKETQMKRLQDLKTGAGAVVDFTKGLVTGKAK